MAVFVVPVQAVRPPFQLGAGWRIEWLSAVIGLVVGLLLALLAHWLRPRIASALHRLQSHLAGFRARLSRRGEDRYRDWLVARVAEDHLLHRYAPLPAVYVPRRLIVPNALPDDIQRSPEQEENVRWREARLHHLVHPVSVTVSIGQALRATQRIAVLGPSGSGRSTLLNHLATLYGQRSAGEMIFPEQESQGAAADRAARNAERRRLPVRVALERADLSLAERRGRHVILAPIVDAVSSEPGRGARKAWATLVRNRIVAGSAILLLDNLDLLDTREQRTALHWIDQLCQTYPGNALVIAGDVAGYEAFWEAGFGTLVVDPLTRSEAAQVLDRWWDALHTAPAETEGEEPAADDGDERPVPGPVDVPADLFRGWEHVQAIDLALAGLLRCEGRPVSPSRSDRYAQVVHGWLGHVRDENVAPPQLARALASVAWAMQSEGSYDVPRGRLESALSAVLADAPLKANDLGTPASGGEERSPAERRAVRAADALIGTGDLIVALARERIGFSHPLFRAFFAAQHAARAGESSTVVAHLNAARWKDTVRFHAAVGNVTPLVRAWLQTPDDLFHSHLLSAAACVADAPGAEDRLREHMLRLLAGLLLGDGTYTTIRQRAAAVLARYRDQGVLYILAQATQHHDPEVRAAGVAGLSHIGGERAFAGLEQALLDGDRLVRVQALYGAAEWGGGEAIRGLIHGLQDENPLVRRVSAELLAAQGTEGQELLREATEAEDMFIRRAAVFGLAKIDAPWALERVRVLQRRDAEWLIRSAAEYVVDRAHSLVLEVVPDQPPLCEYEWLSHWASSFGLPCASTPDAERALIQAIRQGEWPIKVAAADTLGARAGTYAIPALRAALDDEHDLVREAAFSALYAVALRTRSTIPA